MLTTSSVRRFPFLVVALSVVALTGCRSTKHRVRCCDETNCCQPSPGERHEMRDDGPDEQRVVRVVVRGHDRGPVDQQGDDGPRDGQLERIHREIHERLDRLSERVAELARRLDEMTGERRRAARALR